MGEATERKRRRLAAVLERDGHHCAYCGVSLIFTTRPCEHEPGTVVVTGHPPTLDHDIPRSRGGTNDLSNLVAACLSCNAQKRAKTGDEYRAWLATRP